MAGVDTCPRPLRRRRDALVAACARLRAGALHGEPLMDASAFLVSALCGAPPRPNAADARRQ